VVTNCGRDAEERQDFNRAVDLYSRGLDADDLAESFYQGLMRCYARLGQYAEAVAAYGRCRHMLSVGLGQGPSLATERLHQSLRTALTEDDVTSQANK
jgi:pentatricopeptide repeat protein